MVTGRLLEVACSSKEKEQRARKARDEGGSQDYGDVVDTMTKLSLGSALDGSEKSTTSSGIGTCFSSAKEQNIISQSYIYSRTSSMAGRWKWHLRPYSLVASIALIITCVLLPGSPRFFVAARQDDQDSVYMQSTTESSWASVVVTPDIKARFLVLADNATNATTADDTTTVVLRLMRITIQPWPIQQNPTRTIQTPLISVEGKTAARHYHLRTIRQHLPMIMQQILTLVLGTATLLVRIYRIAR